MVSILWPLTTTSLKLCHREEREEKDGEERKSRRAVARAATQNFMQVKKVHLRCRVWDKWFHGYKNFENNLLDPGIFGT